MILDSFFQDVRVGLRVLFKDKTFCFLAVLVLGLGIGGATTQFTVVNAVVLRGFSFPHPEQLVSVGLIDPKASDQNNNFGFGQIPTEQDYEDLKATQKSCSLMAGYLSGSTINLTNKNNPQRYNGGYVTEDVFKIDPSIYFAVAALLTVVAALSCFVPARRATRIDPVEALRYE